MAIEAQLRKIKLPLCGILFILGLYGFGVSFSGGYSITQESPLGDVNSIVADKNHVYLSIPAYNRVQVYDKLGHFQRTIKIIHSGSGTFYIKRNPRGFSAFIARGNICQTYSPNGLLLTEKEDQNFEYVEPQPFSTYDGVTYKIDSLIFTYPRIISTTPNGEKRTLIRMTFGQWLINFPTPTTIFMLIGFGVLFLELVKVGGLIPKK